MDEKRILNDLSRIINRAEEYGKKTREKDQNRWLQKYSWKYDNVFDIAAWGRGKATKNEKKEDNSNDLMVFLVIFIDHNLQILQTGL